MSQSDPAKEQSARDDGEPSLRQLGDALQRRREKILARWQRDVRQRLPKATDLTLEQLRDDLPEVLEMIGCVLADGWPRSEQVFGREAPAHGMVRYHQEFSLRELLLEYQIFRQAALAETFEELGRTMTLEELVGFEATFDAAIRRAAEAYTTLHMDQIRLQSESLGRFLAFLSHDLRNSLNAALLSMDVLSLEADSRSRGQQADPEWQNVGRELQEAGRLIRHTFDSAERILHAELLRQGKVPLEISDVRVWQLAEGLSHGANRGEAGAAAKIRIEGDPDLVIHTDRALLETVLQNLIGNAIKHGEGAPIVIRSELDAGDRCRIEVIDHGPGIAPDVLPTLFKPFERGETKASGAGLGLSIAAHASRLLQGTITAESELGKGSTFRLVIPRRLEPPPKAATPDA